MIQRVGKFSLASISLAAITCAAIVAADAAAQGAGGRSVTQGPGTKTIDNLYKCPVDVPNHRISAVGTITSTDGKVWTVPAETVYQTGPKGADLYND